MKRIALIVCPPVRPDIPPLSVVSLDAFLRSHGAVADIYDLNSLWYAQAPVALQRAWRRSIAPEVERYWQHRCACRSAPEIIDAVRRLSSYPVVGFSCLRSNYPVSLSLARLVKQANPGCRVVFGGPDLFRLHSLTDGRFPDELRALADTIVVGDGETALLRICRAQSVPAIIRFEETDSLDGYAWEQSYLALLAGYRYPQSESASLQASRGCPRRCRFCSERLLHRSVRRRSVPDLVREIDFHRSRGVRRIVFHDSMFNADLAHVEELCVEIIDRYGGFPWEAQIGVRADMPQSLLEAMKRSGCYNLFVGLESGSAATLRRMRKGYTPEQAAGFFRQLSRAGLAFGVSLIVGFPGEDEAAAQRSLEFLLANRHTIKKIEQINPYVPYAGTESADAYVPAQRALVYRRTSDTVVRLRAAGFRMSPAFVNNLVIDRSLSVDT